MTEAGWLAETDSAALLRSAAKRFSLRKRRLFGCGCCRLVWREMTPACDYVVGLAEGFADGRASKGEMARAHHGTIVPSRTYAELSDRGRKAADAAKAACDPNIARALAEAPRWASEVADPAAVLQTLRCIFGNPFRPAEVDPAWLTADAVALARGAYEERKLPSGELDPHRLSVLADALEESGAPGEAVGHLRSPGPHFRGCWAVDLVMGRA